MLTNIMRFLKSNFSGLLLIFLVISISNQGLSQKRKKIIPPDTIVTNTKGNGTKITIDFQKGIKHNHPMMAFWLEDESGNYIQTLYVNQSVAKGHFGHVGQLDGKWVSGELQRPASLPVWAHKRNIKNSQGNFMPTPINPVPDALTGATPPQSFILNTKSDQTLPNKFKIFLEINQAWDWNDYWTNNKFPDDDEYKSSAQPSVIYMAEIDQCQPNELYVLKPIGIGHYSGKNGQLYPELNTITTALQIVQQVSVKLEK